MTIQVLGSGCATCKRLYDMTQKAVEELGWTVKVEYKTGNEGIGKIIELGIIGSPVLVVDDKPVMVGFTPDIEKIKSQLNTK